MKWEFQMLPIPASMGNQTLVEAFFVNRRISEFGDS